MMLHSFRFIQLGYPPVIVCRATQSVRPYNNKVVRVMNDIFGFLSNSRFLFSNTALSRHHYSTRRQQLQLQLQQITFHRNAFDTTRLQQHLRTNQRLVTPICSIRYIYTQYNTFDRLRIQSSYCTTTMQQPLLIVQSRKVGCLFSPPSLSVLPLVASHHHYNQYQQIRTFVRRKKRRTAEKMRQRRSMDRRRGLPVYFQHHNEKKYKPINLRTHIGRVLNKATRGERPIEFLINFVEEYMKYDLDKRKTVIIPYIRENFQSVAYDQLVLRICQGITFTNNNTGMNGINWMIQFRKDLMEVIYDKAEELKTLHRKRKLMQLRLLRYDKIKRMIRKEMSLYIHELSSQAYPITIPTRRLSQFPTVGPILKNASTSTSSKENNPHQRSNNIKDELNGTSVSADLNNAPSTTESNVETNSDVEPLCTVGHIRRVYYNELTVRFIYKNERTDPQFKSKFLEPNKYVYGWYQTDDASTEPDALIFVSLLESIPTSLDEIHSLDDDDGRITTESARNLSVATFYDIKILNPALEKIGLGEYMIRPTIQQLLDDTNIPLSITKFSTLLPLYSFRNWLLCNGYEEDISLLVVNDGSDDFITLMREWECPKEQVFRRLKALLNRNYTSYQETVMNTPVVSTAVDNLLLRSAASYLVRAKTPVVKWRCNPLEISTRYHVAQGASIHRINLAANPTEGGWDESLGLMTNHIYNVQNLESNQAAYNKKFNKIDIHEAVMKYVPKPRKLQLTKEQREKWIPTDPIREQMIKLSQNGKLFKVPLYGPPELSRKKTFHLRLVPKRVRPSLIPPVVPTVGVSGLTVYVKPARIAAKTAAVPSYVMRTVKGKDKPPAASARPTTNTFKHSGTSYWPDEVEFSLPTNPVQQEKKRKTSASQRGNRKREKASWDS